MNKHFRTYDQTSIRKVYHRYHRHFGTVIYSDDNGITWHPVGVDTGKWHMDWIFAFIER